MSSDSEEDFLSANEDEDTDDEKPLHDSSMTRSKVSKEQEVSECGGSISKLNIGESSIKLDTDESFVKVSKKDCTESSIHDRKPNEKSILEKEDSENEVGVRKSGDDLDSKITEDSGTLTEDTKSNESDISSNSDSNVQEKDSGDKTLENKPVSDNVHDMDKVVPDSDKKVHDMDKVVLDSDKKAVSHSHKKAESDGHKKVMSDTDKKVKRLERPRKKLGQKISTAKNLEGISCDSQIFHPEAQSAGDHESQSTNSIKTQSHDQQITESPQKEQNEEMDSWGGWGDWGSSLVSTASLLSKEVTKTVGAVLESVSETGVQSDTNPEASDEPANATNEEKNPSYDIGFKSFGSFVSGMSGVFETASNTILMGGLDTLEKIGRKTMDIIQDGDPGLARKRQFLKFHKPNLSAVLKDARARAINEEEERNNSEGGAEENSSHITVGVAWDDTGGSAHLEALSLISKQCREKRYALLRVISPVWRDNVNQKIEAISSFGNLDDDHKNAKSLESTLSRISSDVCLPLQFNKLMSGWPSLRNFLNKLAIEIHSCQGDEDLLTFQKDLFGEAASFVAEVVSVVQKAAEMSLITPSVDGTMLAKHFSRLCAGVSGGLEEAADDVCETITQTFPATDPQVSDVVTNIYVQVSHLNSYLESSLLDLLMVLSYVEAKKATEDL